MLSLIKGEDPNLHNRVCGLQLRDLGLEDDSSVWLVEVEQCKATGCGSAHGNGFIIAEAVNVVVT